MVLYPNKLPESERVCFGICIWILVLHVRSPVLLFPALAFSIPFLYTSIYRFSAAVQPAVD